jgi:hypothetical protein
MDVLEKRKMTPPSEKLTQQPEIKRLQDLIESGAKKRGNDEASVEHA